MSLADALFSKTQQKLLGLFFNEPERSFYFNEVVRTTEASKGTVVRELERLANADILLIKRIGNQVHYQVNKNNPIYNELKSLVHKTIGIAPLLQQALTQLDTHIELAFIYGSVAKGEEHSKSDIDLFIITDSLSYTELINILAPSESYLGRTINPSVYTKTQVLERLANKQAFMTRIMEQPRLWLKGNDDELEKLRQFSKSQAA